MDNIQSLNSLVRAAGFLTSAELSLDGGEQLTILVGATGEQKRAFSVALRPDGVYVLGFRGCFRLDDHADVFETVARLAIQASMPTDSVHDLAGFPLQPYPYKQWLHEGQKRVSAEQAIGGWTQLIHADNAHLWDEFSSRFSFRMGMSQKDWPGIVEPSPFVTWVAGNAQKVYESDRKQFHSLERQSQEQLLVILKNIGSVTERMFVLNLNHPGFSFAPSGITHRGMDAWPVALIPVHNYFVYADPTFSIGLFGHPWEASVCVFGEPLVDQMADSPLAFFGEKMRSSR